ncbi:TPA: ribonuclease P protein component 2 [archaeon]|nr:ribonuclease P protein component 2 [Candidatus Naiadarchaeales archaeon SRR2090153.bin461]
MVKFKVKPSQKENWRYIAFELISNANFTDKDIVRAITSANLRLYGEVGTSEENLWLIEYNANKKSGIIRCSHKAQQKVIAALTIITKINEQDSVFNILGVSGTIKKTKEKYF